MHYSCCRISLWHMQYIYSRQLLWGVQCMHTTKVFYMSHVCVSLTYTINGFQGCMLIINNGVDFAYKYCEILQNTITTTLGLVVVIVIQFSNLFSEFTQFSTTVQIQYCWSEQKFKWRLGVFVLHQSREKHCCVREQCRTSLCYIKGRSPVQNNEAVLQVHQFNLKIHQF